MNEATDVRYRQAAHLARDTRYLAHIHDFLVRRYSTCRLWLTLIAALAGSATVASLAIQASPWLAGSLAASGAVASFMNLIFRLDDCAQTHRELAQRYHRLDSSVSILRNKIEREGYNEAVIEALEKTEADLATIRNDEKAGRAWFIERLVEAAHARVESEFPPSVLARIAPKGI